MRQRPRQIRRAPCALIQPLALLGGPLPSCPWSRALSLAWRAASLFFFIRSAGNEHRVGPSAVCNLSVLRFRAGLRSLVGNEAGVQKVTHRPRLDGKVHVFRNVTEYLGKP